MHDLFCNTVTHLLTGHANLGDLQPLHNLELPLTHAIAVHDEALWQVALVGVPPGYDEIVHSLPQRLHASKTSSAQNGPHGSQCLTPLQ